MFYSSEKCVILGLFTAGLANLSASLLANVFPEQLADLSLNC